jgi:hypothetical protein
LFDNVSGDESAAGDVEYRAFYVFNNHASLTLLSPVIWISALTSSSDDEVDLAVGTSAVNGTEQTVSTESTAPTGVSFSRPTSKAAGLALGDIPAQQHRAVWVRRTVNAGAAAFTNNAFTIRVEGDTQA